MITRGVFPLLKITLLYCLCMFVTALTWKSGGNVQELVLSSPMWIPRVELRSLGWAASTVNRAILLTQRCMFHISPRKFLISDWLLGLLITSLSGTGECVGQERATMLRLICSLTHQASGTSPWGSPPVRVSHPLHTFITNFRFLLRTPAHTLTPDTILLCSPLSLIFASSIHL